MVDNQPMKLKLISLLAIPVALLATSVVPAQAATASRYITVNSEGKVKVVPDAVRLNATVTLVAASNKEALGGASTTSAAVRAALLANGVDKAQIQTQSITVYPEYNYTQDKGSVLVGYRASQNFVVIIKNAPNAGAVVDAVIAAGGDNIQVQGVTPFVLDNAAATAEARSVAVKNAKAKATSYTKLLGVKLGKVNYLTENSSPTTYVPMLGLAKSASDATVVDLGEQDVIVSITIQWALG